MPRPKILCFAPPILRIISCHPSASPRSLVQPSPPPSSLRRPPLSPPSPLPRSPRETRHTHRCPRSTLPHTTAISSVPSHLRASLLHERRRKASLLVDGARACGGEWVDWCSEIG
ncbi:hypothetical protein Droror1_Dr00025440 [Drosera rotundifolia]